MTTATLLSVSTPNSSFSQPPNISSNNWWRGPSTATFMRTPSSKLISLSSPSSTSIVEQDSLPPPPDAELHVQSESTTDFPIRGCKACGKEEIEKGCNGEGRIQGGVATFPGLGWWPIKAYRPCPGFVASGGRYRRKGQSMDEVISGKGRRETSVGNKQQ